jgi:GH25 family lysozyme M1 (1,4-beta-N-acetylmuramidase)
MSLYPDISHHHPVNNWVAVKQNCPFLISKATEGTTFVDSTLGSFIKGCELNGIPYWLYTFLRKGHEKAQAEFMVKNCKDKVGKYFVGYILDVERDNDAANVKAAMDYINGLGVKTMVYTGYKDYNKYSSILKNRPAHCAWWEARYGQNTGSYSPAYPCHTGIDLHQYTSNGSCNGISGRCDLNRIVQKGEAWYKTPITKATATAEAVTVNVGVLKSGMKNNTVKALQMLLNGWGYNCGTVDGSFGPKTVTAVKNFQKAKGLTQDAVVGAKTWEALLK